MVGLKPDTAWKRLAQGDMVSFERLSCVSGGNTGMGIDAGVQG